MRKLRRDYLNAPCTGTDILYRHGQEIKIAALFGLLCVCSIKSCNDIQARMALPDGRQKENITIVSVGRIPRDRSLLDIFPYCPWQHCSYCRLGEPLQRTFFCTWLIFELSLKISVRRKTWANNPNSHLRGVSFVCQSPTWRLNCPACRYDKQPNNTGKHACLTQVWLNVFISDDVKKWTS